MKQRLQHALGCLLLVVILSFVLGFVEALMCDLLSISPILYNGRMCVLLLILMSIEQAAKE
jgi:hypothetical protein